MVTQRILSVRGAVKREDEHREAMDTRRACFTVAEYFAGIGLVRMALESCGWSVVFANDIAHKKYEMYRGFFPDAASHYRVCDVFQVDPASVPQTTLATCSFPCVDLSLAGNMSGISGKHSSAFWGFVRILKAQGEAAPALLLIENVPGWLCSNKGADFRIAVQALNDLGYACDLLTLNALRFVPQSRPRVFLVGSKLHGRGCCTQPMLDRSEALLSNRAKEVLAANEDLSWFHTPIPRPPPLLRGGLSSIVEALDDSDKRWWAHEEVDRHVAMMAPAHQRRVRLLVEGDRIQYRTFFRRRRHGQQRVEVRSDDIAGCLRTAIGGSGKQFLIRAGRGNLRMRAMTPREYARLQGVPDRYPIAANGVQALSAFGDAVCVPLIEWIARHVLGPLAEEHQGVLDA